MAGAAPELPPPAWIVTALRGALIGHAPVDPTAVDAELDRLSLLPRDFKASRSDVVKAAVSLLATHSEAEIIEMLAQHLITIIISLKGY